MKIKRWCLLLLAGMFAFLASAQQQDEIKLSIKETAEKSAWTVEVAFENAQSDNYTAFQMDFQLPEGFVYEEGSLATDTRLLGHVCTAKAGADGQLRVVAYSAQNMEIPGKSGNLFSFRVRVGSGVTKGTYTLAARNVYFAKRDGLEFPLPGAAVKLTYDSPVVQQEYAVVYLVDGAEYLQQKVLVGTAIPAVADPVKEGHTFVGWEGLPDQMPDHAVQVVAKFSVNTYTVTYLLDGKEYGQQQVKYGEAIEPLTVEDTDERTFLGWEDFPATMPAHDLTIQGKTELTGIEQLTADSLVDVYTLLGKKILSKVKLAKAKTLLPAGVYLINGSAFYLR